MTRPSFPAERILDGADSPADRLGGAKSPLDGLFVFLMAFAEVPGLLGVLVPGVVMMFAVGALIGAGAVGFWPMYWLSVLGARARRRPELLAGAPPARPGRRHLALQPPSAEPGARGGLLRQIRRQERGLRTLLRPGAGGHPAGGRHAVHAAMRGSWWPTCSRRWRGPSAYLAPGIVLGASLELASEVAFRLVLLVLLLVAGTLARRLARSSPVSLVPAGGEPHRAVAAGLGRALGLERPHRRGAGRSGASRGARLGGLCRRSRADGGALHR